MKKSLIGLALALPAAIADAAETSVAVAANFTKPVTEIAALFAAETGHSAVLSFGASGQFHTQITQGAPFQVFLSADADRPARLVAEGLGVEGSRFTYAIGELVLWSADAALVTGPDTLTGGDFEKIAIADPASAPYGRAAVQTMAALGLTQALAPKLVRGNNISQTLQFVETGNAELGFVALSQVAAKAEGSRWVIPGDLHDPIRQDAVLLKTGADNEAARAFLDFLKGPQAAEVIARFGYTTAPAPAVAD